MTSALTIVAVALVIWLIQRENQTRLDDQAHHHRQELDRIRKEAVLQRLLDLQAFTRKDGMLIHFQEKVMPDRLDTYLNTYEIEFLRGKPLAFTTTYYAMLKKLP